MAGVIAPHPLEVYCANGAVRSENRIYASKIVGYKKSLIIWIIAYS